MSIRTIIVEDEPLAREHLRNLLERDADIQVVAECADGRSAVAAIQQHRPDLLFLDIQLPERNGFEVLSDLGPARPPAIVFVTAYDRFAVKAFDVHAVDYLLKPFDLERFEQALHRAKKQLQPIVPATAVGAPSSSREEKLDELLATLRGAAESPGSKRISVKSAGKLIFLRIDEIDCVEAADNYIDIRSAGQIHRVRETLGSFESKLPPTEFVRISRSAIVNIDRIKELQPCPYGDYTVILQDGTKLTLTRGYRGSLGRLKGKPT